MLEIPSIFEKLLVLLCQLHEFLWSVNHHVGHFLNLYCFKKYRALGFTSEPTGKHGKVTFFCWKQRLSLSLSLVTMTYVMRKSRVRKGEGVTLFCWFSGLSALPKVPQWYHDMMILRTSLYQSILWGDFYYTAFCFLSLKNNKTKPQNTEIRLFLCGK